MSKESSLSKESNESVRQVQEDNLRRAQSDKGPDEAHGAELHITEKPVTGTSGDADAAVDPDVTPRNLEADSDGA